MERLMVCAREWAASVRERIREGMRTVTLHRAVAVVVALSLWMGVGGMDSSAKGEKMAGETFGEVHWYSTKAAPDLFSAEREG